PAARPEHLVAAALEDACGDPRAVLRDRAEQPRALERLFRFHARGLGPGRMGECERAAARPRAGLALCHDCLVRGAAVPAPAVSTFPGQCPSYNRPMSTPYYAHHVFFCLNHRDSGRPCCASNGAERLQAYAK